MAAILGGMGGSGGLGPNERWGYDRVQIKGGALGLDPNKAYWVNRDRVSGQLLTVIGEASSPGVALSEERGMMGQRNAAQVGIEVYRPWRRIADRGLTVDGRPTPALREVADKLVLIEGFRQIRVPMTADQAVGFWANVIENRDMSAEGQELLRDYWVTLIAIARQFGGAQQTPFEWFSALRGVMPLAGDSDETLRRSITVRLADKWKTSRATASQPVFDSMFEESFGYRPNFDTEVTLEERLQGTAKAFGPPSPLGGAIEKLLTRIRAKGKP